MKVILLVAYLLMLKRPLIPVDHNIIKKKLDHFGARKILNKWFESYLTDQKQFVSINGFNSNISTQWSPCKVHHFADDTNLLIINKSPKHRNKFIIDLKNLTKNIYIYISLNVSKTEMVLFRPKRKSMDFNLKRKLNQKRLYETNSVKYLGIRIHNKLNWTAHINDIALKLFRANAMLYKVRDLLMLEF